MPLPHSQDPNKYIYRIAKKKRKINPIIQPNTHIKKREKKKGQSGGKYACIHSYIFQWALILT